MELDIYNIRNKYNDNDSNWIIQQHKNNLLLKSPNGKLYKGSGILLFTKDNIILFSDTSSYQDIGGTLDKHIGGGSLLLIKNAIKEAYEESAKMFNFSDIDFDKLEYVDVNDKNVYYRCYLLCIELPHNVIDIFLSNRKILLNKKVKYTYLEMNGLNFFDFYELKLCIKENKGSKKFKICKDMILRSRTCKILDKITKKMYENTIKNCYKLKNTITNNPDPDLIYFVF